LTENKVSPDTAKALLKAGYVVRVERSPDRIYKDAEYEAAGTEMVPAESWVNAPLDDIVLGLKELPEGDSESRHLSRHF
jgi:saccharopine dehydrogenase (NAD+, L-lysine-forming)